MVAGQDITPLVAIVGPTGSGKSALALHLAERFHGAIIAADSRTVYKGMDIGTAKPSTEEQQNVPHYGLDVVTPDQSFTVYDFKQIAQAAIADANALGRVPFLVGGTGLYVDAVLYDFAFRRPPNPALRSTLNKMSVAELQAKAAAVGLPLPENHQNPRHLIRLLEGGVPAHQSKVLRPRTLVLGLQPPLDVLRERLWIRAGLMIDAGLEDEAGRLFAEYGDVEALRTPAYRAALMLKQGRIDRDGLQSFIVRNDFNLAKRQRSWFKRNACIHWLYNRDVFSESVDIITTFLNK